MQNEKIFSISEIIDQINSLFNDLGEITLSGEISSIQPHPTGIYLTLTDPEDGSILNCYIHPRAYAQQGIILQNGLEIQARGSFNIYKQKGRFSFMIRTFELAGEGALKKSYEILKKKLGDEGLFDRKRLLPSLPRRIAIITSRTGAVIDDFKKNIISLGLELTLYSVRVEGVKSVSEILSAIQYFNHHTDQFDALVLMRGGGSLEDLQAFNNEELARAIFSSKIPTVVAIGHDRDIPIAQMVADAAPSTPTAAAILLNQSWQELQHQIRVSQQELHNKLSRKFEVIHQQIDIFKHEVIQHIGFAISRIKDKIDATEQYLVAINPTNVLQRGYSFITTNEGNAIRDINHIKPHQKIKTHLARGQFSSIVDEIL